MGAALDGINIIYESQDIFVIGVAVTHGHFHGNFAIFLVYFNDLVMQWIVMRV